MSSSSPTGAPTSAGNRISTTKDELIDYANRSGLPEAVLENLQEIEEDDEVFESIEELWPDYPSKEDFLFNEDEY